MAAGAKVVVKFALCPMANVNGSDGVLSSKYLPDTVASVMMNGASLEFAMVTIWLRLEPTGTLPKFRSDGLTARLPPPTHPDWITITVNIAVRMRELRRRVRTVTKQTRVSKEYLIN